MSLRPHHQLPPPTPTPTPPTSCRYISDHGDGHGYWLVGSDGGIFTFGSAQFYGSTGALHLNRPVVGITPTTDRGGYWLDASDGGIFSFGDAGFYGSIPGLGISPAGSGAPHSLNAPIVGMVPSADGNGYFMVGADGGVFTFGDAHFEGSCPAIGGCPGGAAVSVIPDSTGNGYWLVTAGGGVTPFGDAPALGTGPGGVVSAARSADGGGYYLLYPNGVVYAFGDAVNYGSAAGEVGGAYPAATIFTTADGGGYWIVSSNGSVVTEGDAPYDGGANNLHLNGSIIAGTGWWRVVLRAAPKKPLRGGDVDYPIYAIKHPLRSPGRVPSRLHLASMGGRFSRGRLIRLCEIPEWLARPRQGLTKSRAPTSSQ